METGTQRILKFKKAVDKIAQTETDCIVSAYEELIEEYNKKYPTIDWQNIFDNL